MDRSGGHDATSGGPESDRDSQVYRVSFGPSETVAEAVVGSVASFEGVEPMALPPIHDVVDPEALDRLLASARRELVLDHPVVAFTYAGYRVTVRPDEIRIRPSGGDAD